MIDVAFPPVVVWERGVLHGERFAGPKTFALEPVPQRMRQAGGSMTVQPRHTTNTGWVASKTYGSSRAITGDSHRNIGSMQAQIARQLLIAGKDDGGRSRLDARIAVIAGPKGTLCLV